ncbi:phosphotransferase family protein [Nocardia africana]
MTGSAGPTMQFPVPGVDPAALCCWMDTRGLAGGPLTNLRKLGGGTQNIMLRFVRGEREFVLRRGPLHLRVNTNDNLLREIRLLDALAKTRVPHAKLIAACSDEQVLGGAVFYLMEPVDGFNAAIELPQRHASDVNIVHEMGIAMVDALAVLSTVDYQSVGLADFGRPEGFLDRQVPRWLCELESYMQLDGYSCHNLPVDSVAEWLIRNQPSSGPVGIMHGDYHIANVLFDQGGPQVTAIVDWEMCTIGDPLLDLGWLLATWPEPGDIGDPLGTTLGRAGGPPPWEVLIERYHQRTGLDVSAAEWYAVLACFKLGIILEGTYARSCAGLAPAHTGRTFHSIAESLFSRACFVIGRN